MSYLTSTDTSLPLKGHVYVICDPGSPTGDPTITYSVLPIQVSGIPIADPAGGIALLPRTEGNTEAFNVNPATVNTITVDRNSPDKMHHYEITTRIDISDYSPGDILALMVRMQDDGSGLDQDITVIAALQAAVWRG